MTDIRSMTEDWLLNSQLAPGGDLDPLQPLYEAARCGELVLPFCSGCRLPLELEQTVCDGCGAFGREWTSVELRGVVHSWTTVHRREPGLVRAETHYPVIDVELESGHRLVMTTTSSSASAPPIGTSVRIAFRTLGDAHIPAVQSSED